MGRSRAEVFPRTGEEAAADDDGGDEHRLEFRRRFLEQRDDDGHRTWRNGPADDLGRIDATGGQFRRRR